MFNNMFNGYYDSYTTIIHRSRKAKPTTLYRKTCPTCDSKRVNLYYSNKLNKYICKECTDKLLGEKGSENET